MEYRYKIKIPAQKIFLDIFTGLFGGEIPPFMALCSQGISDKQVLTTPEMHQLNSKQVQGHQCGQMWDEHGAIP